MATIIVEKNGDRWVAVYNGKEVAKSKCKSCVVQAIINITKESNKYTNLLVLNEDGPREVYPIGAANARAVHER